ncbi:hypothetical protein [Metabacillus halosaccharovorans]|uniref:GNAT family N-acetyltransferase n=1 Tax=Metabacillus halosaccharovorans TaxID=930124 RepID=A0ABT3DLM3_9BACI|nr:hypothetical protein [Metabacillus halosaccharovorans]MCV9887799.1 hypothetical protein [Metabacillus halosaccharovorans]
MRLYDVKSIEEIDWKTKKDGEMIKYYFEPLMKNGSTFYMENVQTELFLLEIDDIVLPLTVNNKEFNNSYVTSPFTHYITYAKEELWELKNPLLEKAFSSIIDIIGKILKKSNLNKVVIVNNWLLSTNLMGSVLTKDQLFRITNYLVATFPQHTILFRSLTENLHRQFLDTMHNVGYQNVMSRAIYLFNYTPKLTKKHEKTLQQDKRLFEKYHYYVRKPTMDDIPKIKELYDQLYINKYSRHNPQFTKEFFEQAFQFGFLQFMLLCQGDKVKGVIGYWVREGVLTTPVLGYNTKTDKKEGLYRVLSYMITECVLQNKYIGHRSAGAGEFKRNRGSVQQIEYSYFYHKHLPVHKRLSWTLLKVIMSLFVESLAKKKGF